MTPLIFFVACFVVGAVVRSRRALVAAVAVPALLYGGLAVGVFGQGTGDGWVVLAGVVSVSSVAGAGAGIAVGSAFRSR